MECIQPTPTPFVLVEPIHVVEVSSSEEDPEEDPKEEPKVQQPEPDVDMLPASEDEVELVIKLDPVGEAAPELVAESVEESGSGWLVESDESADHDYQLSGWLLLTPVGTLSLLPFRPHR